MRTQHAMQPVRGSRSGDGERRPSASERLARGATRLAGIGALAYGVLLAPKIVADADLAPAWWTWLAVVTAFGTGVALIPASWAGMRTIRLAIACFAVGYVVPVAMFPAVWNGTMLVRMDWMWFVMFPGLPAFAAAIVWRPLPVLGYLAAATIPSQFGNWLVRIDHGGNPLWLDTAYSFAFSGLFVGACLGGIRAGRILDSTADAARRQAADTAAQQAGLAERRRLDAFVHDGIMAALLSAANSPGNPATVAQASVSLRELDRLGDTAAAESGFTALQLVAHVRSAAASADDAAEVQAEVKDPAAHYPAAAVRALGAGVAEAVRNARRHAGTGAVCRVRIVVVEGSVQAAVVDDGVGFDPAAVPAHRLGIQASVLGRFAELDGGWSTVDSAPGAGTRIVMGWRA